MFNVEFCPITKFTFSPQPKIFNPLHHPHNKSLDLQYLMFKCSKLFTLLQVKNYPQKSLSNSYAVAVYIRKSNKTCNSLPNKLFYIDNICHRLTLFVTIRPEKGSCLNILHFSLLFQHFLHLFYHL